MGIKFREAKIEDYEQMYRLWEKTEGMGLSESDTKENIERFLNKNPGLNFVCEDDEKLLVQFYVAKMEEEDISTILLLIRTIEEMG